MKGFLLFGCAFASTFGFCSFELVLVADEVNHCIHRYDGESGVYLGKFGANRLSNSLNAIAIDQARNRIYVADYIYLRAFNYNTGEYISSITAPTGNVLPGNLSVFTNGDLLISNGTSPLRLNFATGATVTTYNASAGGTFGNVVASTVDEQDNVFLADGMGDTGSNSCVIDRFNADGTYLSSSGTYIQAFSGSRFQQMQARGGRIIVGDSLTRVNILSYGAGAATFLNKVVVTGMSSFAGTAMGHGDVRYVSGTDGSGNSKLYAMYENGFSQQTIPTPQIGVNNIKQIAVVVAPEPGSLIGLSLSMVLIARRKKK